VQKIWNFDLPPDVSVLIIRYYKEALKHKMKKGKPSGSITCMGKSSLGFIDVVHQ